MFPVVVNTKASSSFHNDGRIFRLPDEPELNEHHHHRNHHHHSTSTSTSQYPQFFHNEHEDDGDDSDGDIRTVRTNTSLTLPSIEENPSSHTTTKQQQPYHPYSHGGSSSEATPAVFPISPTAPSTNDTTVDLFPNSPFHHITTTHYIQQEEEVVVVDDEDDDAFAADDERDTSFRTGTICTRIFRNTSVRPRKNQKKDRPVVAQVVVDTSFPTISGIPETTTAAEKRPKLVTPTAMVTTSSSSSNSNKSTTPTVSTSSHSTHSHHSPDHSRVYHYLTEERIAMAMTNGTALQKVVRATDTSYSDRIPEEQEEEEGVDTSRHSSSWYSSTGSSPSPHAAAKRNANLRPSLHDTIVEPILFDMSIHGNDAEEHGGDDEFNDQYSLGHHSNNDDDSPFVDESSYSFSLGGGNVSVESPPRMDAAGAAATTTRPPSSPLPNDVDSSNWIKTSWSYLQMMAQAAATTSSSSSSFKVGTNINENTNNIIKNNHHHATIVDLDESIVSSQPSMANNTYNNNNNDILSLNDDQLTYDSTLFRKKNDHDGVVLMTHQYNNHHNNYGGAKDETSTLPSTGSTYEYVMQHHNAGSSEDPPNLSDPVKLIHEGTQSTFVIAYGSSEDDSTKDMGLGESKPITDEERMDVTGLALRDGTDQASSTGHEPPPENKRKQRRRKCARVTGTLLVVLILAFATSEVVCYFTSSCRHLGLFSRPNETSSDETKSISNVPPPMESATPATAPMSSFDDTSVVPTSAPSLRVVTTNEPTLLPTTQESIVETPPTAIATFSPTVNANTTLTFNSTDDLYDAVDLYLMTFVNGSISSTLPPIEQWDVSQLYNLSKVFSALRNPRARYFNADLSMWNVSNAVYMRSLFQQAEHFNGNIATWDVSRVIDMYETFTSAYQFNQDISSWNVANVQEMSGMFANCAQFNQNIGLWNTSNTISMHGMFKNAPSFNQDLFWNTARVTDMSQMFEDADAFDGDVSTFNIGNVVNLRMMFRNAISFTGTPDLSSWNFSNVTDATEMFYGARSFQGTGVSFWTIDSLLSPNLMFAGATAFDQELCMNWDTPLQSLDGTKNMFAGTSCPDKELPDPIYPDRSSVYCSLCNSTLTPTITVTEPPLWTTSTGKAFTTNGELREAVDAYMIDDGPQSYVAFTYGYPIGAWDVSMLTDFSQIFDSSRNSDLLRFNADLSGWNVSNAVDMHAMFQQTVSFKDSTDGLASWDVSKVTDMSGMFASSAFSGNISAWQVGRVVDFSFFADFASSFTSDMSMWNVSSAQDMSWMFRASKLFNSNLSAWDVRSVTDFSNMFSGASSFNQNLCTWGPLIHATNNNATANTGTASPTVETRSMFSATACPYLLSPNVTAVAAAGPWCTSCTR